MSARSLVRIGRTGFVKQQLKLRRLIHPTYSNKNTLFNKCIPLGFVQIGSQHQLRQISPFSTSKENDKEVLVEKEDGNVNIDESIEEVQEEEQMEVVVPIRLFVPDDGINHNVTVTEWYKKEGEQVSASEAICEIDTPDFSYDFQSNVAGFVAKIMVPAGTSDVEPGDTIAFLAETEEDIEAVNEEIDKMLIHEVAPEVDPVEATVDMVDAWLEQVDPHFKDLYGDVLRGDGFDSLESIKTLNQEDLEQMGVKKGHIRVLLKNIETLS